MPAPRQAPFKLGGASEADRRKVCAGQFSFGSAWNKLPEAKDVVSHLLVTRRTRVCALSVCSLVCLSGMPDFPCDTPGGEPKEALDGGPGPSEQVGHQRGGCCAGGPAGHSQGVGSPEEAYCQRGRSNRPSQRRPGLWVHRGVSRRPTPRAPAGWSARETGAPRSNQLSLRTRQSDDGRRGPKAAR